MGFSSKLSNIEGKRKQYFSHKGLATVVRVLRRRSSCRAWVLRGCTAVVYVEHTQVNSFSEVESPVWGQAGNKLLVVENDLVNDV